MARATTTMSSGRAWARSGDLWSGGGRAWRRWMRGGGSGSRGPLVPLAILLAIVMIALLPVHAEQASEPCEALEIRVAGMLSAPGTIPGFGETGRHGRAAARRRLPWLPPAIGSTAAWWHVVVWPSAAPGWFAAMR
jgi:hypothetical protein